MQEAANSRTSLEVQTLHRAIEAAERKLARIIEREGDAGGKRREPWYLCQLIDEAIEAEAFTEMTITKCANREKGQPMHKAQAIPNWTPLL